jgi:hypothetical protein
MHIKFLKTTEGKTKDRIRNETFREEIIIQNLLTEFEEKRFQWYGHVKRMARKRMLRRALEL